MVSLGAFSQKEGSQLAVLRDVGAGARQSHAVRHSEARSLVPLLCKTKQLTLTNCHIYCMLSEAIQERPAQVLDLNQKSREKWADCRPTRDLT